MAGVHGGGFHPPRLWFTGGSRGIIADGELKLKRPPLRILRLLLFYSDQISQAQTVRRFGCIDFDSLKHIVWSSDCAALTRSPWS